MRLHDIAFYSATFFLLGVFIASFKISFLIIILINLFIATIFLFCYLYLEKININFKWLTGLSFIIIIGAFYYFLYSAIQVKNINIPFGERMNLSGIVINYPENGINQKLTIQLQPPYFGKILANLKPYPAFNYGDLIEFSGIIKSPEPKNYANYLSKNNIFGIMNNPKINLINGNQASPIKKYLFKLKEGIIKNFQNVLSPEKSAFLAGITLGERAEFSKEFKEKMSQSGTTHLVALSGYNITVIAIAVSTLLSYFLRRRIVFWLSILTIIAFVLMTGAEASVVRAAIMGGIILLAKQIGRIHSMRNAIVFAALLMVLFNPKILRFDIGFQLSFAALIGIVYLAPSIQKFFKIKEDGGFLGWRENFLNTASAQLAVLPLLLINFGNFSLFSLPANILILEAIPLTMSLGFLTGAIGFFSFTLSLILGWFTGIILTYELIIIDIFSKISLPIGEMGIFSAIIYYFIIIWFIIFNNRNKIPLSIKR